MSNKDSKSLCSSFHKTQTKAVADPSTDKATEQEEGPANGSGNEDETKTFEGQADVVPTASWTRNAKQDFKKEQPQNVPKFDSADPETRLQVHGEGAARPDG
ncbi:hypothetical protein J7T55_010629 [Diaporthe amygdali]|uniref:uncharacterized protein n=1 Tax=Phomopsis amygdali TaxID=1214568 RepID=UPI0022FEE63B|nr:uncharacterized protein J7T55_010629 [Diaporthe amygdali]KAJ0114242.1 hypothetical protein J7T55_010629 [Diaporthe amygdali]